MTVERRLLPGRLIRSCRGLRSAHVLLLAAALMATPATSQAPSLDGHWVAAELVPDGLWFVEAVEINGMRFKSTITGFARTCVNPPKNDDDKRFNATLECQGTMTTASGNLVVAADGRSAKASTAVAETVEFDVDEARQKGISAVLLTARSGWTAEIAGEALLVRSGEASIRYIRMPAGRLRDAAYSMSLVSALAMAQSIQKSEPAASVHRTESLRWRCIAREVSRGTARGDEILAHATLAELGRTFRRLEDELSASGNAEKLNELRELEAFQIEIEGRVRSGESIDPREVARATLGTIDAATYVSAVRAAASMTAATLVGGKPINSYVCGD